jgi:hypothetical protein
MVLRDISIIYLDYFGALGQKHVLRDKWPSLRVHVMSRHRQ